MSVRSATLFAFLALAFCVAYASDPSQLQDFCVATDNPSINGVKVFVNGQFCKNPNDVVVDDFIFRGLNIPGKLNDLGAKVNLVEVTKFKGLNTLGLSVARIDYGPHALNVPHIHPRGSEVLTVLEGSLYVGFVTSNLPGGGNKLYATTIGKGEAITFPQGLIHFQLNVESTPAVATVTLSSQNPGRIDVADAVFGSNPPILPEVLTKAFRFGNIVTHLQTSFGATKD